MALQLGFYGVKLAGSDSESLEQAISLTLDKYRELARSIRPSSEDRRAVYWRLAFSIISVHSPFGATCAAYRAVRLHHARFGRLPGHGRLTSLLRTLGHDGMVLYCPTKARYLLELEVQWQRDRAALERGSDSEHEWRLRLAREVRGLGIAKASFAVALCHPHTSDVCCIDSHMHRLLMGWAPRSGSIGKRRYLELEDRIRAIARRHQVNTFAMQWLLWDATRGQEESHAVLREGAA